MTQWMQAVGWFNAVVALVFTLCYAYQLVYVPVALIRRNPSQKPVKLHRYTVLISARDEEVVIGQLLDSIAAQDYPAELLTVCVVADNCSDDTARVAREHGAQVYERRDRERVGKGYALDWLLDQLRTDGRDNADGYLVLDADNLLRENYVTELNKTFSQGYAAVTSYRNSKNYGDNWISSGYALWFLREAQYLNRARMKLGVSCGVSGTGFVVRREFLERCSGWPFHLLTEDIEFTAHTILQGERVGYCETAELFDEQPVQFGQSWRQRMRWAKGYLQVFRKYGGQLIKGMTVGGSFSCYDMTMNILPAFVLTATSLLVNGGVEIHALATGGSPLTAALGLGLILFNACLLLFLLGSITLISEWRHIHASVPRKIFSAFTFPLFMLTYIPISLAAMFCRVGWKPIRHTRTMTLTQVEQSATGL